MVALNCQRVGGVDLITLVSYLYSSLSSVECMASYIVNPIGAFYLISISSIELAHLMRGEWKKGYNNNNKSLLL